MLLGVAVGDALGWPHEMPRRVVGEPVLEGSFCRWRRRAGSRFWSYEETLPAGSYSDDTQLTLACGRSLLQPDWFHHLVARELPSWRLYERGGGRTVLGAADAWTSGKPPWRLGQRRREDYFNSGANGVAMRIAPHAAVGSAILSRVVVDAIATHGHPRALLGACLQAWALDATLERRLGTTATDALSAALDAVNSWADASLLEELPEPWRAAAGRDYLSGWQQGRDGAVLLLQKALDWSQQGALAAETEVLADLGATDRSTNGAGDVCAVAALYLASRYASQPEHALTVAARQPGADTDTLASMVGALLGAMIGPDALVSYRDVQDADTIEELADDLLKASPVPAEVPNELEPRPANAVDRVNNELEQRRGDVVLPDGRQAQVIQQRVLSSTSTPNEVTGHYLRCLDGQGLLVITRRKRRRGEPVVEEDRKGEGRGGSPGVSPADSDGLTEGSPRRGPVTNLQVHLRCPDPGRLAHLLALVGVSSRDDGRGHQVEGAPIALLATDESPRLGLEPPSLTAELTVQTHELEAACSRIEDGGWTVSRQDGAAVVVEGAVTIRLVSDVSSTETP